MILKSNDFKNPIFKNTIFKLQDWLNKMVKFLLIRVSKNLC
jgi:hypothetical protein